MPRGEVVVRFLDLAVGERLIEFLGEVKEHAEAHDDIDLELMVEDCRADVLDRRGGRA